MLQFSSNIIVCSLKIQYMYKIVLLSVNGAFSKEPLAIDISDPIEAYATKDDAEKIKAKLPPPSFGEGVYVVKPIQNICKANS